MNNLTKISDVAKVFGIPTSTLRFWERSGIIKFERDGASNYRQFPFRTLVEIADIIFARDAGTPIADYEKNVLSSVEDRRALLDSQEIQVGQQIARLERSIARIRAQKDLIDAWDQVRFEPIRLVRAKLLPVYRFDFCDQQAVSLYLDDLSQAVDIIPSTSPDSYQYGRFLESSDFEIVRNGDSEEREYLFGPLWMDEDRKTNIEDFWDVAHSMGREYGSAICQYLTLGAKDDGKGGHCYFFKAWLELL